MKKYREMSRKIEKKIAELKEERHRHFEQYLDELSEENTARDEERIEK